MRISAFWLGGPVVAAVLGMATPANALLIDLNAQDASNGLTALLSAGTYSVQAVAGGTSGQAWNAWGAVSGLQLGKTCWPSGCKGWMNYFKLDYGGTSRTVGTYAIYYSAQEALAAAPLFRFTLTAETTPVYFHISDLFFPDNLGGLRLNLTTKNGKITIPTLPEPGSLGLLSLGLLGLGMVYRQNRAKSAASLPQA